MQAIYQGFIERPSLVECAYGPDVLEGGIADRDYGRANEGISPLPVSLPFRVTVTFSEPSEDSFLI